METRNLKVSIKTAYTWYTSGNKQLRELATSLFTDTELDELVTLEYIHINSNLKNTTIVTNNPRKMLPITELHVIAEFLNGDWDPNSVDLAYTIKACGKDALEVSQAPTGIIGAVYFKSASLAFKAIKVLNNTDYILMALGNRH